MFFFQSSGNCSGTVTCHGGYNSNALFPSSSPHLITATNLTPGETYYLMFDGYAGDICDYVVDVANGVNGLIISNSLTLDSSSTLNICAGGSVTLNASGGNGTYTWSPSTGLNTTSGTTVTASPGVTTTYTATSIGTTFG